MNTSLEATVLWFKADNDFGGIGIPHEDYMEGGQARGYVLL